MHKKDKQQEYIVQHREIQPLFDNNFKLWRIYFKKKNECTENNLAWIENKVRVQTKKITLKNYLL